MPSQRGYGQTDSAMNYNLNNNTSNNNLGFGGSNNYYNMGAGMSHQLSGSSGGGNPQMMHNPYFPGGGISSYPYPSHMSMLGQGPGMGYSMPFGMQNPMSTPMASSMPMMGGGHGMMGGGMGQSQQQAPAASTPASTTDNSHNSTQAPPTTSSNQSNVPQMPMPFHPGMYGMAPNPLPYPGMQSFMNSPSMYMPYGMPAMMPFGPMSGMGNPMQSQSSQMANYGQNSYGQSMSQDGGGQGQSQPDGNK